MNIELEERLAEAFEKTSSIREPAPQIVWDLLHQLYEHDPITYEHSIRTGLKTREIVDFTGLNSRGGVFYVLHDIGKLEIPRELLNKTEYYTEEDHEIMKRHPEFGYEILMKAGLPMAAGMARISHCFQGKPYPEKFPDLPSEINTPKGIFNVIFNARMGAIADQYDSALYRKNDLNRTAQRTPDGIKKMLNNEFPDQMLFIDRLFKAGILTGRTPAAAYAPKSDVVAHR